MAGKLAISQEAKEMSGCLLSSLPSPTLRLAEPPAYRMVLPTFRVRLPCSAKPFWKHLHRCVSMVILNLIKQTLKSNHHKN